jgi:PAS domain S-box-containing protein
MWDNRDLTIKGNDTVMECRRLSNILECIGDGLITAATDGKVQFMNKVAEKFLCWDLAEAKGKNIDEVFRMINLETNEILYTHYDQIIATQSPRGLRKDTVLLSRDGMLRYVSASISPVKDMNNFVEAIVIVFRDITRRRSIEDAINSKQAKLKAVFDAAPVGIMIVNSCHIIIELNDALGKILGRRPDQILLKKVGEGLGCKQRLENKKSCENGEIKCPLRYTIQKVIEEQTECKGIEILFEMKKGDNIRKVWFKLNAVPIEIEKEKHVLMVIDDINEHKRLIKELKKAKEAAEAASRAKSEFLANMSHEIRTPLNGLIGMLDLTLLSDLTVDQKENLSIARTCVDSLMNVLNDILDFSKIEAGKLLIENVGFNLPELVEKTVKSYSAKASEKDIGIKYSVCSDVPETLSGDPNRLRQVLNNLLGNAIKFTQIGSVGIEVKLLEKTREYVTLKFIVTDTGIGISASDREKLFQGFSQLDGSYTRKYGGTGLGLAISKQLIEKMDGQIWVESNNHGGSKFIFTTRLKTGAFSPEKKSNTCVYVASRELDILLAEDDKVSQMVIFRMLEEFGHSITIVNNGKEALEILAKHDYDLILMDIQMPVMDGLATTSIIRQNECVKGKRTPIIALTAYAVKGDKEKFLSHDMDDYVSKPVTMVDLFNTIERLNKKITINRPGCSGSYVNKVNDRFFKDIAVKTANIRKAVAESNDLLAEKMAHLIKNDSEILQEDFLKSLAFKIELAVRKGKIEQASDLCSKIEMELDRLKLL